VEYLERRLVTRTLTTLTLALLLTSCASAYQVATPLGNYLVRISPRQATSVPRAVSSVAQSDAETAAGDGSVSRDAWAVDLLRHLGNTQPSPTTVAMLVEWSLAEDGCMHNCGYSSAWERNNWLNSTMPGYGAYATIDSDGVKAYPDYESGMAATVATLTNGLYDDIVTGLQTNNPDLAYRALIASPWSSNRYGGGVLFGQEWRKK